MKFVKHVKVNPEVELEIWELKNGGFVGIEAGMLDQVPIDHMYDPYTGEALPIPDTPSVDEVVDASTKIDELEATLKDIRDIAGSWATGKVSVDKLRGIQTLAEEKVGPA